MVGPLEFRWSSLFMIWQCQPQRSHPQAIEDATSFDVTIRLGVPLWQDDHGGAWFILSLTSRREQPRPRKIVFRRRSFDRAGPLQAIPGELPVRNLRQGIEVLAPRHHPFGVLAKDHARIIAVRVLPNKFGAPRKRPYYAIIVAFCVRNLARAHPSSEQIKKLLGLKTSKSKAGIVMVSELSNQGGTLKAGRGNLLLFFFNGINLEKTSLKI